jgi:lipoate-protein ligase A
MQLLDLTLPTAAENVALDEALLEAAEESGRPSEVLRLWEPRQTLVVIGRASHVDQEVYREECLRRGIPIIRRTSGGAAIVAGPGCLMYAVVLSFDRRPHARVIEQAHSLVLGRLAEALESLAPGIERQGTSDLAIAGRKVSGNSMRARRTHLLYHGTLLYGFPLATIETCLKSPPRQPDYRAGRTHADFVTNLPTTTADLRSALAAAWGAGEILPAWPQEKTALLVHERYGRDAWNFRR